MSQVLALDMPTTLAGNLAPIGCEYQGIRAARVVESTIPSRSQRRASFLSQGVNRTPFLELTMRYPGVQALLANWKYS
jgi:hypothetical protein